MVRIHAVEGYLAHKKQRPLLQHAPEKMRNESGWRWMWEYRGSSLIINRHPEDRHRALGVGLL